MSKDQELVKVKRDTKSLIMKNLIVMAVLIILALTGVISWFTNKTKATADGINVTCELPDGLEVAVVKHGAGEPASSAYKTGEIDITSEEYPFLSKLSLEELTSDGLHFYKPKITQNSSGASVDKESKEPWNDVEKAYTDSSSESSLSYFSVDVYMRSKGKHEIVLGSSSSVKPVGINNLVNDDPTKIENKSDMGDFSMDCIVGAVRVSTVVDNQCKNLWIPAPNIRYHEDNKTGKRLVDTNIDTNEFGTFQHKYWNVDPTTLTLIDKDLHTYPDVIANNKCDYTLGTNKDILQLKPQSSSDDLSKSQSSSDDSKPESSSDVYTGKFTLNLWIDGEDDEARQALVGGSFSASIKLKISDK